jgi:hypothetical protein
MDFQYDNGTGPINSQSPFMKAALNNQRFQQPTPGGSSRKSVFSSFMRKPQTQTNSTTDTANQGDYQTFDSPTRPGASRNTSPTKPLPPVPAFNALYTTPRKPVPDILMEDSSAGETPKSPERQDDSEAGTPAERLALERRKLGGGLDSRSAPVLPTMSSVQISPRKERAREWEREKERDRTDRRPSSPVGKKESMWGRVKKTFNSPGRGEIPRGEVLQNKDHRVRKQRSKENQYASRQLALQSYSRSGSDAEDDDSEMTINLPRTISPRKRSGKHNPPGDSQEAQQKQQQPPPPKEPGLVSSLFTFIGAHPTVPHILSFYAQLMFNLFLLSACAYMIYSFWTAIQGDIDKKAWEASADIFGEIRKAKEGFYENGCDDTPLKPMLKLHCEHFAKVMAQDPMKIARAKVSAHTFAEIFNSFIEPISYKAMLFTAMMIFGCFAVSNFAFGVLRNKAMEQQHHQHPWGAPYNFQAPPPTPQRTFSGLADGVYQGTPWHGGPTLEPAPNQRYELDGQGSPRRRLVYT